MTRLKDKFIEAGLADCIFTDVDLNNLLGKTSSSRYGMVNKAIARGELIKIRCGLYM